MTTYPVHPAADLFPLLDGPAYEEFREDIRRHGQREPILLWRGQLLDGRNRLRACNDLGIAPLTRKLPDDTEPIAFVASANLQRRHLDASQRAVLAVRLKSLYEEEARKRQGAGKSADGRAGGRGRKKENLPANLPEGSAPDRAANESRAKAAAAMNVSPRSVEERPGSARLFSVHAAAAFRNR